MQIDEHYLCQGLGHLTGLETRIFRGSLLLERYSPYPFEPDIAGLINQERQQHAGTAAFIETEDMLVFVMIRSAANNMTLILGPAAQIRPDRQAALAVLFKLGESHSRLREMQTYFSQIVLYPFENFLEIICFVNYALNEEKLSVADLISRSRPVRSPRRPAPHTAAGEHDAADAPHNTWQTEQYLLSCVTNGNMEAIQAFLAEPPTGRAGTLAHDELRQHKNRFIVAVTLICRAAIAGGLSPQTAFALSDRYIQKAEHLTAGSDLSLLNMDMLLDYTRRVEQLKYGTDRSRLARDVLRYAQRNISRRITTADLAKALGMNRTYLCERFRLETGQTICAYITAIKINEAGRLLSTTDLSVARIADSLAFSSQSYLQSVFKKHKGCTTKEYREKSRHTDVIAARIINDNLPAFRTLAK